MLVEQAKETQLPKVNLKPLKKHRSLEIKRFYSIGDVSTIMKVSDNTVRKMMYLASQDPLPYYKWGRVIRIPIDKFEPWLARQVRH